MTYSIGQRVRYIDDVETEAHSTAAWGLGSTAVIRGFDISGALLYFEEPAPQVGFAKCRFEAVPEAPKIRGQAGGLKYDGGKEQWGLLLSAKGMLAAVKGVVRVLGFGAKKYAAHSWREVEDNQRRYTDALIRHLVAIQEDGLTAVDPESGLLHIDHLNCNGLFLAEIARSADQAK